MATFPTKAPQAPEAFENGSGFHGDKTTPKAVPSTSPNPKTPAPKTPEHGRRPQDNPGAVVYDSAKPKKASGGMIRVSKILTRFQQDLTVEEDEPGESLLLRPHPQG